jgi:hypothetical protein
LLPAPLEHVAVEGFGANAGGTSEAHREPATHGGQAIQERRRSRNRSRRAGFRNSRGFSPRRASHPRSEGSV